MRSWYGLIRQYDQVKGSVSELRSNLQCEQGKQTVLVAASAGVDVIFTADTRGEKPVFTNRISFDDLIMSILS